MKKVFVMVSVLLTATLAQAGAQLGDWTQNQLTAVMADGSVATQLNRQMIKAVNSDGKALVVFQIIDENGNVTHSEETLEDASDYMSAGDAAVIVTNCSNSQVNGTLEVVSVPAGKFQACKVNGKTSEGHPVTFWIAAVPFGIAKATMTAPEYTLTQELLSSGTRQ